MKKLIAIVAGLLFVAVLAAAALILFDPFGGVSAKGTILEHEEIQDLKEELKEFFEDSYSYEFKYESEDEYRDSSSYEYYYEKTSGLVSIDYYSDLDSYTMSYDVKGKTVEKETEPTINGKKTYKTKYNANVVKLAEDLYDLDDKNQYYVDAKQTVKVDNDKMTTKYKTQESWHDLYIPDLQELAINFLERTGITVYENDDQYTIIYSNASTFVEVKAVFDGRHLEKVTIDAEYDEGYEKYTFKVIDYEDIDEPRNTGDYKPIPHTHNYNSHGYCECGDFDLGYHYEHSYDSYGYCDECDQYCSHSYGWDGECYYCGHYDPSYDYYG